MTPFLLAQSSSALTALLGGPDRARAVFRVLAEGGDPFSSEKLSEKARQRLAKALSPTPSTIIKTSIATDKTTKLLTQLHDGKCIETVLIPSQSRTTICVSSQIGCARACDFCLTATMGLVRNLRCDEIVAQVISGILIAKKEGLPNVRNVVYMGMGEPLDNLEEVGRSLEILCDNRALGFGPRHVTVSTVGTHQKAIESAAKWPVQLAWSMHAADDVVRSSLIPTAKQSVASLRDCFLNAQPKRPLFVECCLMDGINDRDRDIAACVDLFSDLAQEIRFNLLPLNSIGRDDLRPSAPDRVAHFRDELRRAGHFCMIRKSRGQDQAAACGQLVVQNKGPPLKMQGDGA